jgi:hypothetical protein
MERKELDDAILAIYKSALEKEDNFRAILSILQKKEELFKEVLYTWFEHELESYLFCRGANMPFFSGGALIEFGKLVPNFFQDMMLRVFAPPKISKDEGEGCEEEIDETALQQEWLKNHFPEIFTDVQASEASAEAYANSASCKKASEEFANAVVQALKTLPDPNSK